MSHARSQTSVPRCGWFFDMLKTLQSLAASSLMLELNDISREDRANLLQEFEVGRAHLFYSFAMKLACFQTPPLLICAAAHQSQSVARSAIETCLKSSCKHPRILELQSEPLASEARYFVGDSPLEELPVFGRIRGPIQIRLCRRAPC